MVAISGAVGTYSLIDPSVEVSVAEALGLRPADASTQVVIRDSISEWVAALAVLATVCEAVALEVRHGQRTEVRELSEAFGAGQKGSSAMPHKKNPIRSERIAGLARVVRAAVVPVMEGIPLWHERDISHSSTERVFLPDAAITTDYLLHLTTGLVENLVVDADRMRANLESTGGLIYTSSVLLELVEGGLSREDAYALVQARGDGDLEQRDAVPRDAAGAGEGRRRRSRRGRGWTRSAGRSATWPTSGRCSTASRRCCVNLPLVARGKVREVYDASTQAAPTGCCSWPRDRISAYDHVLPTPIPDKGRVLTALSVWWFEQLAPVLDALGASHHLLSATDVPDAVAGPGDARAAAVDAAGRVRRARLPVRLRDGRVRPHRRASATSPLPPGLVEGSRLPAPVFTPSTKAEVGEHDEAIDFADVVALVGADRAAQLRELTLALYAAAAEIAEGAGILLADTKFEFGLDADGGLVLGDEVLTPDSSRFWPAASWAPGGVAALVRQAVRARLADRRRAGTASRRRRSCPTTSSRPPASATSPPTSSSPAAPSPDRPRVRRTRGHQRLTAARDVVARAASPGHPPTSRSCGPATRSAARRGITYGLPRELAHVPAAPRSPRCCSARRPKRSSATSRRPRCGDSRSR